MSTSITWAIARSYRECFRLCRGLCKLHRLHYCLCYEIYIKLKIILSDDPAECKQPQRLPQFLPILNTLRGCLAYNRKYALLVTNPLLSLQRSWERDEYLHLAYFSWFESEGWRCELEIFSLEYFPSRSHGKQTLLQGTGLISRAG